MTETTEDKIRAESAYSIGICKYCGQAVSLLPAEYSQEAADQVATARCDCFKARQARIRAGKIFDSKSLLRDLLCGNTPAWDFQDPVMTPEELQLLDGLVQGIVDKVITSATVEIHRNCKVKISMTGDGKIKVRRSETRQAETEC